MAVRVSETILAHGLQPGAIRIAAGLSEDGWQRRMSGRTPWGVEELERIVAALHVTGRALVRLTLSDLVDPGAPLRPRGHRRMRGGE